MVIDTIWTVGKVHSQNIVLNKTAAVQSTLYCKVGAIEVLHLLPKTLEDTYRSITYSDNRKEIYIIPQTRDEFMVYSQDDVIQYKQ